MENMERATSGLFGAKCPFKEEGICTIQCNNFPEVLAAKLLDWLMGDFDKRIMVAMENGTIDPSVCVENQQSSP